MAKANPYSAGDQFNNWTVLSASGRTKKHEQLYKCQCICGTIREVRKDNLGKVLGCGCTRRTYKKRTNNPATPKKSLAKKQPVKVVVSKQKAKKVIQTESQSNKPSVIARVSRKLEDIQLAKELDNQYLL